MKTLVYGVLSLITTLCFTLEIFGQADRTLQGVVIDSKTKEPVPFASVFLSTTMIGTRTTESGAYSLKDIPPAKYDLTVSSIGYKTTKLPVLISDKVTTLNVSLEPDVKVLNEVVVKYSKAEYQKYREAFVKFFLGQTQNASKCKIVNLDQVSFNFDKEEKVLTASCDVPIEVTNKALGYRLFYYLETFKLDYKLNRLEFGGTPFFKPIDSLNARDFKYTKARDKAYYGSMNHFMRSLRSKKLYPNHFLVYILFPIQSHRLPGALLSSAYNTNEKAYPDPNSYRYFEVVPWMILTAPYETLLNLKIVYTGESQEYNFNPAEFRYSKPQTSYLKYLSHNLVIHENGYYEDPFQYFAEGYWAWSEKIAELLPLEYEPVLTIQDIKHFQKLEELDSTRTLRIMEELR